MRHRHSEMEPAVSDDDERVVTLKHKFSGSVLQPSNVFPPPPKGMVPLGFIHVMVDPEDGRVDLMWGLVEGMPPDAQKDVIATLEKAVEEVKKGKRNGAAN